MLRKSILFLVILLSFGLFSLQRAGQDSIKNFTWLLGTWKMESKRGIVYENWKKVSNKEFRGISYMLNEKDTIVLETISLLEKDGLLHYIPTVVDQNDGKPVVFNLISIKNKEVIFENKMHDFPQRISYSLTKDQHLMAIISGEVNNTEKQIQFLMQKVNN